VTRCTTDHSGLFADIDEPQFSLALRLLLDQQPPTGRAFLMQLWRSNRWSILAMVEIQIF